MGDPHRFVHGIGFDQVEAGEELARLGERTVGDAADAIANAQCARGGRGLQLLGVVQATIRAQGIGFCQATTHQLVVLGCWQLRHQRRVDVDQDQVLHRGLRIGHIRTPIMPPVVSDLKPMHE